MKKKEKARPSVTRMIATEEVQSRMPVRGEIRLVELVQLNEAFVENPNLRALAGGSKQHVIARAMATTAHAFCFGKERHVVSVASSARIAIPSH